MATPSRHRVLVSTTLLSVALLSACHTISTNPRQETSMSSANKQKIVKLLKSIETGESKPVAYINPRKYIQHNPAAGDGLAGLVPCYGNFRRVPPA